MFFQMHAALNQMQRGLSQNYIQINNGRQFSFFGPYQDLVFKIEQMTEEQIDGIVTLNLFITGRMVKQINFCCTCATCLLGCCLCFPLCFMCCQWWKKIALQAYEIPLEFYQAVQRLFKSSSLVNVIMILQDNQLGAAKADLLHSYVYNSQIKKFSLINRAQAFSYGEQQCYDNFELNFGKIRSIGRVISTIEWTKAI